jgi:2-polyprenyl-3-methyl-5-hydroxy-6-metoxy-1,4-benzoquinol methylase
MMDAPAIPQNARDQIAMDYYRTTAKRSHKPDILWYRHVAAQFRRRVKDWLPQKKSARILDIGYGCGEFLVYLQELGYYNLIGVDCCSDELTYSKRFVHAEFVCTDIQSFLDSVQQNFEMVCAFNVLEHLQKEELVKVLYRIKKRLIPGGTLLAIVPNAASPFAGTSRYWDFTHQLSFTTNSWQQLAIFVGFDPNIEFRDCGPVPHGLLSFIRYGLWQIIRVMINGYLLIESANSRGGIFSQDLLVRLRKSQTPNKDEIELNHH